MKRIFKHSCAPGGIFFSLLFLCSCATTRPPLPANVSMSPEAGRGAPGDWVIAMVRVNGSEPVPLVVDTGCPVTCLDQSLDPKLGKRLTRTTLINLGVLRPGGVYESPQLCLGTTPLRKSGPYVLTTDCSWMSEPTHVPVKGFLGMDVLKHYCVQLDFQSGQVRFLGGEHADKSAWGKPFHLSPIGDGCVTVAENFTGAKGPPSMIDTGCDSDGFLVTKLFEQWTNHITPPAPGQARSPNGTLDGEPYRDLDLDCVPAAHNDGHVRFNMIGIHSLSENLVTFDFPKQTLYLKQTSDWPLASREIETATDAASKSVATVLGDLLNKGRLPGWHPHDQVISPMDCDLTHDSTGDLITCDLKKTGESSIYHYTFSRKSPTSPWNLRKAWRADQEDHTVEEYSVR